MAGSSKTSPGMSRFKNAVARFVSRIRPGPAWYDTHLPLLPVPSRLQLSVGADS